MPTGQQHQPKSIKPPVARRAPHTVMRLARMGSAHQTRLSFMRTLLRRLQQEAWQFSRPQWQIDTQGVGYAVYQATGPQHTYSLVAFAHDLPDELRSDRVIAQAWDTTFALFDGIPNAADIERLKANVPKQEAGRVASSELSLSRANRSERLFHYVIDTLAKGQQPDQEVLDGVGYLMRTTAVYGSGKFGAADRERIEQRAELSCPFQVEMLTVWLIRAFTLDLVEYLAKVKGKEQAVVFEPQLRRCLGVGNSTGLGMAPFLINHPTLINNWMMVREEALSRVRSLDSAEPAEIALFRQLTERALLNAQQWQSKHTLQQEKLQALRADLQHLYEHLKTFDFQRAQPWNHLYQWAEQALSLEGQEQLVALLLEPYGELIDGLTHCMNANEKHLPLINGTQKVTDLCQLLETHYDWALATDFTEKTQYSRFWYVSEEKLEPRLGERFAEPGMELEQPLCISWHVRQLYDALKRWQPDEAVASFLLKHSEFRHVVRRVQQITHHPYMEVRDNLIAADMLPIDLLRLKLSFFGATRFDPRSDRWVRIALFRHAPFPHELMQLSADDWAYPPLPIAGNASEPAPLVAV